MKTEEKQQPQTPRPKENGPSLPEKVAEKFSLAKGTVMKFACPEFGEVDLSKVTIEFAERLAKKGYLVEK